MILKGAIMIYLYFNMQKAVRKKLYFKGKCLVFSILYLYNICINFYLLNNLFWIKSTEQEAEGKTYLTFSRVELHWNSHIDSLRSYWSIVCFLPRCHKTCCSVKNAKRFLNQPSPILAVAIWQYEQTAAAGPLQLDDDKYRLNDSGTWIIDAFANLGGRYIQTRGCWTAKLHRPFETSP